MDNDWNGLADLTANLITKYAGVLDLDNIPNPTPVKNQEMKNSCLCQVLVGKFPYLFLLSLFFIFLYHKQAQVVC